MFLRSLTHGRLLVLGVNPLQGSVTLDSWMGTDHGIYPWDITLVMGKFDGGVVLGGLWMVFLWDPWEEKTSGQKTSGHVPDFDALDRHVCVEVSTT